MSQNFKFSELDVFNRVIRDYPYNIDVAFEEIGFNGKTILPDAFKTALQALLAIEDAPEQLLFRVSNNENLKTEEELAESIDAPETSDRKRVIEIKFVNHDNLSKFLSGGFEFEEQHRMQSTELRMLSLRDSMFFREPFRRLPTRDFIRQSKICIFYSSKNGCKKYVILADAALNDNIELMPWIVLIENSILLGKSIQTEAGSIIVRGCMNYPCTSLTPRNIDIIESEISVALKDGRIEPYCDDVILTDFTKLFEFQKSAKINHVRVNLDQIEINANNAYERYVECCKDRIAKERLRNCIARKTIDLSIVEEIKKINAHNPDIEIIFDVEGNVFYINVATTVKNYDPDYVEKIILNAHDSIYEGFAIEDIERNAAILAAAFGVVPGYRLHLTESYGFLITTGGMMIRTYAMNFRSRPKKKNTTSGINISSPKNIFARAHFEESMMNLNIPKIVDAILNDNKSIDDVIRDYMRRIEHSAANDGRHIAAFEDKKTGERLTPMQVYERIKNENAMPPIDLSIAQNNNNIPF